jgi:hypothetical protein
VLSVEISDIRRQRLRKRVIGCKLVQHIYLDCMRENMVQIEASKWKVSCEDIRNQQGTYLAFRVRWKCDFRSSKMYMVQWQQHDGWYWR